MRRVGICEERGSGIDKVIFAAEAYRLPPPDFEETQRHTKATLFAPKKLNEMTKGERIRACYQHACLEWVSNRAVTNTTLRKRLGISDDNYPAASAIIGESLKSRLIKPHDPESRSRRHARYVPFWA
jgi:predicted HTH transcriptional regulator